MFINNIDINIITQTPKIKNLKNRMINNIASLCKISKSQINQSIIKSNSLRKIIVNIAKEAGEKAAHIGGALSCIDFKSSSEQK